MSNPRKLQFHYYQGFTVIDQDQFSKEQARLESQSQELNRETKRLDNLIKTEDKLDQWMRELADPKITPKKAKEIRSQIEALDYWKESIEILKGRYKIEEIASGAYDKVRERLRMDRITLNAHVEILTSRYYRDIEKNHEQTQIHFHQVEENWKKQERKYITQFQRNTWSMMKSAEQEEIQSPENISLNESQTQTLQLLRKDALDIFANLKTKPIQLILSENWHDALSEKDLQSFISPEMLAQEVQEIQSVEDREQIDLKEIFARKLMSYLCRRWNDFIESPSHSNGVYIDKVELNGDQLKITAAEIQAQNRYINPIQIIISSSELAGKAWRRSFSRWTHLTETTNKEPFFGFMDNYHIETTKSEAEAARLKNEIAEKVQARLEEKKHQQIAAENRRSEDYLKSHHVEIFEDKFSQDRQERSFTIREYFTIPMHKAKNAIANIDEEVQAEMSPELKKAMAEDKNLNEMRERLDNLEKSILKSYVSYTSKLGELESHYDLALVKVSPQGAEETIKQYPQLFSNILTTPLRAAVDEFIGMLSTKKSDDINKIILVFNKLFDGVLKIMPKSSTDQIKEQLDAQINLMAENRDLIAANINQILSRKREMKMMSSKNINLSPLEMMSSAFNFVDIVKKHLTENINMMQDVSPFIMDQSGTILVIDREKLEKQVAEEHISRLNAEQDKIKAEIKSMRGLPQELLDKLLLYQAQIDAYVKVVGDKIDSVEINKEEKEKQQEALELTMKIAEEEKAKANETANLKSMQNLYGEIIMDIHALAHDLGGKEYYVGIKNYSFGEGSKVAIAKELASALSSNIDVLLKPVDASTEKAYINQMSKKLTALMEIVQAFKKADSAMGIAPSEMNASPAKKHARYDSAVATTEDEVSSDEEKKASLTTLKKGWKGKALTIFGKVSLKDFSNKFHSEAEASINKIIKTLQATTPSVSPDSSLRTRSHSLKRNSDSDS